jgi:hypothetical protein
MMAVDDAGGGVQSHRDLRRPVMMQDDSMQPHLQRLLDAAGDAPAGRARADFERLWMRVRRLLAMDLISPAADRQALELASLALQLPVKAGRAQAAGRPGQLTLRQRAEQAAELMIGALGEGAEELAERTAAVLRELAMRTPAMEESRLLRDAVGLEDFGVSGLFVQAMALGRHNGPLAALTEGFEKREQYGYWEARLKDGFCFEPVRQMARRRLEMARQVAKLLAAELGEDGPRP